MKPILDGLRALGAARLAALGAVGAAMLGLLALLAMRGGAGSGAMSLLYADLDPREVAQIVDQLDRAHIAHQEPGAGDRVLVPASEVARARLALAKDGLPSGGSIGYEIFDRGDALTSTQFQQQINETRAMEGEIARSIRMITGVRAARVHLVLPKRQAFSHDTDPAQASVLLTMAGGARLDNQGVQAVLNLVAAAVPGLKAQAIAIIDNRGNLLARAGQPTGEDSGAQTGDQLRRTEEIRLTHAVEDMLEQSLGPGHVRAEAAVTMNYEHFAETHENYDPDQQVVRSTETVTDTSKSTEAEKATTVQNNLPNADAGAGGQTGSQQQRQEETTNYEIGKTIRTLSHDQPQIAKVSMAVMVDGLIETSVDGKAAWHERKPDEIARIKRLVSSTIGFDAKRGDVIDVVSMHFAPPEAAPLPATGFMGVTLEKTDIMMLAQSALLGLAVLIGLLFVLRPMALRLAAQAPDDVARLTMSDGTTPGVAALPHGGAGGHLPGSTDQAAALALADESMVAIASIEGQIRASSIRQLAGMVEKHPEESLAIIRSWMTQERT